MEKIKRSKNRKKTNLIWFRFKKNKLALVSLVIICIMILTVILVSLFGDYSKATDQNIMERFQSPNKEHWFGTDDYGRDVFWRVLYGMRISLFMGIFASFLATIIGSSLGTLAGYYGGKVETLIMRLVDVFMAVPLIILAIAIVAAFGTSIGNILLALSIAFAPGYARLMRAQVLSIMGNEYIEACKACGTSDFRIIVKHIIPNAFPPLIVVTTAGVAGTILIVSGLSFYGLGIQPPTPEWGYMIAQARNYIRTYPYLTLIPAAFIAVTVICINLIGDAIRDSIDPKLKN